MQPTAFLTTILASLVAAAIPTQQQCAAASASASCHTSCSSLRNNLNTCLCNTPEAPEDVCHDAQVAYVYSPTFDLPFLD
ncbi:hypothetical protein P3342_002054 [Pyrenophora teres f. teres]|nr:hypothetical protein HRS9139_03051 [Pyrenophora teres f. teres]KAE8844634.1 hypothetical protein PTNB85_02899 [Pyrenophora teres f. teres]KAE8847166.1 hypothetical protein HRS9122_04073 [Pyrenophora teres f. teres]KAE8866219.1 hypothetical protein PTNB29_03366 [Pyrenophora teres f. teres]KAE8871855.1 hypothetical protein PTNB73_03314 [Pyrenophora teres f. teres]